MGNDLQTMRHALMAQALGDLDALLGRVESFAAVVDESEKRLHGTVAALDKAGDRYRSAITVFTDSAKAELIDFNRRECKQVSVQTLEDLRASMHTAASAAFRSEASDKAAKLGIALSRAAKDYRRSKLSRLLEHGITALVASACTAGFVVTAILFLRPQL